MKSEMFEANQSRISHQDLAAFSFSFIINVKAYPSASGNAI